MMPFHVPTEKPFVATHFRGSHRIAFDLGLSNSAAWNQKRNSLLLGGQTGTLKGITNAPGC
jgi:hypothetical protein